jgi:hypothetical protein
VKKLPFVEIAGFRVDLRYVGGGVVAIALVVLLVVSFSLRPAEDKSRDNSGELGALYGWVTAETLYVPNELAVGTQPEWQPFRERRERWTDDEVAVYWLDPTDIGIDILESTVHDEIAQMLEAFP